jgi:hypothetical protein
MADLHAELEHYHTGEDGHITIERQRERHHNLKGDYGTPVTAIVARALLSSSSPKVTGGCLALARHLCMVVSPCKFRPHLPKKYDGSVNLTEFLHSYTTTILASGGNEAVKANYFLVALTGTAWSWLMNLSEWSLTSLEEFCHLFTANSRMGYSRPCNETDFHAM